MLIEFPSQAKPHLAAFKVVSLLVRADAVDSRRERSFLLIYATRLKQPRTKKVVSETTLISVLP